MVESTAVASAAALTDEQLQAKVLTLLKENDVIEDSEELLNGSGNTAAQVDAALKSLLVDDYVVLEVIERKFIDLTAEAKGYVENGTPEFQYTSALVVGVQTPKTEVEAAVGQQVAKIGFAKAMKNKWVKIGGDKKELVERVVDDLKDAEREELSLFVTERSLEKHDKKVVDQLKKR